MHQKPIRIRAIERLDWLAMKIPDRRQDIGEAVLALLDYVREAPQRVHPLDRDPEKILDAYCASDYGSHATSMKTSLPKEQYEELLAGLKDCVVYCQVIVDYVKLRNKRRIAEYLVESKRKLRERYRTS